MVIAYGLVYGPQLIGFTDRDIVLRMATVYGDHVWSVYGLRNHTQPHGYFFGAGPYADWTQEFLTQTIRKPHLDRPYASAPEKSIRGTI